MKRIVLAAIAISITMASFSQTDTTRKDKADTIKIGGMIIIKKPGKDGKEDREVVINKKPRKYSAFSTNWWIFDLGFANYSDNTNYSAAASSGFVGSGIDEEALQLRTGKSVNVNIWLFMQRLAIVKRYVHLKYGLGVELNNYRFDNENVILQENPTKFVLNSPTTNQPGIKKNKLAADYVTVPAMINFNFTPGRRNAFGFSAGVSAGYLYSARQKFKYTNDSKHKTHDDFDLNKWKISYIGELSLGPIRLYGSLATKTMWEKGLDQTPYNVGIRFSHF